MELKHPEPSIVVLRAGFGGGAVLLAVLGGALAGAAVALLTAPRSGAESRHQLLALAMRPQEVISRMPDAVAGAAEAFSDALKVNHKRRAG
jgi:gas vesicle protein